MAWLKKTSNPLAAREQTLKAEITALEEQIRRLDAQKRAGPTPPRPGSSTPPARQPPASSPAPPFDIGGTPELLEARPESPTTPQHFNDLGMRKFDLPAAVGRLGAWFRGPTASNPKLMNLLAAGSVQGLRPLRRERRIERRRFLVLVVAFLLVLLGIASVFINHH